MTLPESELSRLVRNPARTVEEGALLIAKDAYPKLDVGSYLERLDELAEPLAARTRTLGTPMAEAKVLGEYLFNDLGFHGNLEDYYDVRNSYLNRVIDLKKGIPLTLSVLILALSRRASLHADGIQFPGHFLVRLGGPQGCYIDPFLGARVLSRFDLEILIKRSLGRDAELQPEHLTVADTRTMLIRMLNNLRGIFQNRGDHARAMLVCDRLVDLDAGASALRDRGLFALALGSFEVARADLGDYLSKTPNASDRTAIERAISRVGSRENLN